MPPATLPNEGPGVGSGVRRQARLSQKSCRRNESGDAPQRVLDKAMTLTCSQCSKNVVAV
jgi:hypothetical protein